MNNLTIKDRYLDADKPNCCPKCAGDEIEGGSVTIEGQNAVQSCWCSSCDAAWTDIYALTDITGCEGFDPNAPVLAGSVISGTHRPQDLVPAFLNKLRELDAGVYEQVVYCPAYPMPPAYAAEDSNSEWWDSDECAEFVNETLIDALDVFAPDDYFFGAHPGDGSDFGYWPVEAEG
jgi:hypothetical protein